jgi:hypothetical protein
MLGFALRDLKPALHAGVETSRSSKINRARLLFGPRQVKAGSGKRGIKEEVGKIIELLGFWARLRHIS